MKRNICLVLMLLVAVICGVVFGYAAVTNTSRNKYEEVISQIEESFESEVEIISTEESEEVEMTEPLEETTQEVTSDNIVGGDSYDKYNQEVVEALTITEEQTEEIRSFFSPISSYPYTGDMRQVETIKEYLTEGSFNLVLSVLGEIDTAKTVGMYEYDYDNIHVYVSKIASGEIVIDMVYTGKDPESAIEAEDWVYKKDMNIRALVQSDGLIDVYHISLTQ